MGEFDYLWDYEDVNQSEELRIKVFKAKCILYIYIYAVYTVHIYI